jgi:phage terminase large subunit
MKKAKAEKSKLMAGIEYELRGGNGLLFNSTEQEVMLAGGAETGKTVAALLKAHKNCGSIPGVQGAIVRKTQSSLVGSVVKSYLRIIEPSKRGIKIYGGAKPERFIYPNGSVIWMGGMDNPNKVLSSERDFIYVNQAEELTLDDWETLLTRATGRGAVVENPQIFGDCNPGGSMHWIRKRKSLRLLKAIHQDNPSLFTINGEITPQGKKSLAALNNLTGIRRKRLLEGIWATAEGAVYDMFDASIHVCVRDWREMKRWFLAMDEGYTNPAVILLIGEDGDTRQHCFREFYKRGVLQADVVAFAKRWFNDVIGAATGEYKLNEDKSRGEWIQGASPVGAKRADAAACDEAAAGLIADLNNAGVTAYPAKGRVMDGINRVQNRLKKQGDGKPRFTMDPSCTEFQNEMESYVWKDEKDVPVKEFDHANDGYRYLLDYLNEPTGAFESASDILTGKTGDIETPEAIQTDEVDFDNMEIN